MNSHPIPPISNIIKKGKNYKRGTRPKPSGKKKTENQQKNSLLRKSKQR